MWPAVAKGPTEPSDFLAQVKFLHTRGWLLGWWLSCAEAPPAVGLPEAQAKHMGLTTLEAQAWLFPQQFLTKF